MLLRSKVVNVPAVQFPIASSPGFEKKELSEFKCDACGLCAYGCRYCSSNWGNYLRIRRNKFFLLTKEQLGESLLPNKNPELTFLWPDILKNLHAQIAKKKDKNWGEGRTLVYAMLTDGYSPPLVENGTTEAVLRMILEETQFRIRVLTKNAIVGSDYWLRFFQRYRERFVVGLSIGSMNNDWARRMEIGTPPPTARIRALHRLQDAGIATYGMMCPMFPEVLHGNHLERLVDAIRPDLVEDVWAEPYNSRTNWEYVREAYELHEFGYQWMTEVFGQGRKELWSRYATDVYLRLRKKAEQGGWLDKLIYLLYEKDITADDTPAFSDLKGVSLQGNLGADAKSKNPHIAALQ